MVLFQVHVIARTCASLNVQNHFEYAVGLMKKKGSVESPVRDESTIMQSGQRDLVHRWPERERTGQPGSAIYHGLLRAR